MLTEESMLNRVINTFNINNLAMDDEGSCYYEFAGKRCAIGLFYTEDAPEALFRYQGSIDGLIGFLNDFDSDPAMFITEDVVCLVDTSKECKNYLDTLFSGVDVDFLTFLQFLHDDINNWCDSGLSTVGKDKVEEYINDFDLDPDKVWGEADAT